jgi:cobalt/nickel transport system permease protein
MGGFVSQFASTKPDGLEWSITKVTGQKELKSPERGLHTRLNTLQEKTAFWPGYSLKKTAEAPNDPQSQQAVHTVRPLEELKDTPNLNVEGLVGGTLTLILSFLTGFVLKIWKRAP